MTQSNRPGRWVTQDTIRWYNYQLDRMEGTSIFVFIVCFIAAGAVAGIIGVIISIPLIILWCIRNWWLRHGIRIAERRLHEGKQVWLPYTNEELRIMSGGWGVP